MHFVQYKQKLWKYSIFVSLRKHTILIHKLLSHFEITVLFKPLCTPVTFINKALKIFIV